MAVVFSLLAGISEINPFGIALAIVFASFAIQYLRGGSDIDYAVFFSPTCFLLLGYLLNKLDWGVHIRSLEVLVVAGYAGYFVGEFDDDNLSDIFERLIVLVKYGAITLTALWLSMASLFSFMGPTTDSLAGFLMSKQEAAVVQLSGLYPAATMAFVWLAFGLLMLLVKLGNHGWSWLVNGPKKPKQ